MNNANFYILESNGSYRPIGKVEDVELEYDTPDYYQGILNISDDILNRGVIEETCNIFKEFVMAVWGFSEMVVIKCCPNKRVRHLALHGRKARTRKKNFHRAIKILEELK